MATREQEKRQLREAGPYYCGLCFRSSTYPNGPDNHCKQAHPNEKIECLACGVSFKDFPPLNSHVHDAHITDFAEIQCRLCDYNFGGDVQKFTSHMMLHYHGSI